MAVRVLPFIDYSETRILEWPPKPQQSQDDQNRYAWTEANNHGGHLQAPIQKGTKQIKAKQCGCLSSDLFPVRYPNPAQKEPKQFRWSVTQPFVALSVLSLALN